MLVYLLKLLALVMKLVSNFPFFVDKSIIACIHSTNCKFIVNKILVEKNTFVYGLNIEYKLLFQSSFGYYITFDNLNIRINPIISRSSN